MTIPGSAVGLVVVTAPAGAANGAAFTTQPQIAINDGSGNRVTSSTANVTVSVSTGATLVGTTTVPATAGLATFTNLGITGSPGIPYTLTFASSGLTSITATVTPVVGPGAKLAVTTQAAGATSGAAFTTQPQVTVQDTGSHTVSTSTASVTASVSTGATLVGTAAVAAVAGVAKYTNLGVTGANGTYTLTFSSSGMTDATQTITIGAGGGSTGVPTIVAVSPKTGTTSGGTSVTLSGTNFTGTTRVAFGNNTASNVVISSATQMTALAPAGTAGAVSVTVTNASGTGTLTNGFTYTDTPNESGEPIGGGVLLYSEDASANAEGTELVKGVKSAGSAKSVSIPLNQATRIRVSGLIKKQKFTVDIKINGSWVNIGKAASNNKGNAALRAIAFQTKG
ncbi:MAG: IPT/TIG domain-containing protein, partial [Actinomycetales bacterium]